VFEWFYVKVAEEKSTGTNYASGIKVGVPVLEHFVP
jgi:hypothetical protein